MSERYTENWGDWGQWTGTVTGAGSSEPGAGHSNHRLSHSLFDQNLNQYPKTAPLSGTMEPFELRMLEYVSRLNQHGLINESNDPFDPRPIDPIVEHSLQARHRCKKNDQQNPSNSLFSSSNATRHNVVQVDEHVFMDGHVLGMSGMSNFLDEPTDFQYGNQLPTEVYSQEQLNHQPCPRFQTQRKDRLKTNEGTIEDENPRRKVAKTDEPVACMLKAVCDPFELRGNSDGYFLDPASTIIESSEAIRDVFAAVATATPDAGGVPTFVEVQCDTAPAHSLERLHGLMRSSILSQEMIQAWDMRHGLSKSHSWTVMQTSQSRRQIMEGRDLPTWYGEPLDGDELDKLRNNTHRKSAKRKKPVKSKKQSPSYASKLGTFAKLKWIEEEVVLEGIGDFNDDNNWTTLNRIS